MPSTSPNRLTINNKFGQDYNGWRATGDLYASQSSRMQSVTWLIHAVECRKRHSQSAQIKQDRWWSGKTINKPYDTPLLPTWSNMALSSMLGTLRMRITVKMSIVVFSNTLLQSCPRYYKRRSRIWKTKKVCEDCIRMLNWMQLTYQPLFYFVYKDDIKWWVQARWEALLTFYFKD